jgi:hypothetical protein
MTRDANDPVPDDRHRANSSARMHSIIRLRTDPGTRQRAGNSALSGISHADLGSYGLPGPDLLSCKGIINIDDGEDE